MKFCIINMILHGSIALLLGGFLTEGILMAKDSIAAEARAGGIKEGKEQGKIEQLLTNNLSALTEYRVDE